MRRLFQKWLSLISLFGMVQTAYAVQPYNMPRGVTPLSHDIYDLHMAAFWICVGIAVVVFGVMFYSIIMHRKSKGAKAAQFHEHTLVEITWAIIPFIILIVMAIPATKILMNLEDTSDADLTIKVTGYQWRWRYEYLDQGINFFSNLKTPLDQIHNKTHKDQWYLLDVDHPLVIPTDKKVRLLVTANDVIHSWWVPDFGIKRDAIPGFIHAAWVKVDTPGTYRGQCAELCGTNHAYMPIVVVAMKPQAFNAWVAQQTHTKEVVAVETNKQWTKAELMAKGEEVYNATCVACHKPDGTGMPPVFPAMKGSKVAAGPIAKHIAMVLNGVPGTAMQAFGAQLNDEEIAAVVTYERNAWGNNSGDVVQPADVKAARSSNP